MLAQQTAAADAFFNRVAGDLPELPKEQLVILRLRLTISLVTIRLSLDHGDKENGLPDEILIMIREKTAVARKKISKET